MRALFSMTTLVLVACGANAPPAGCPSGVLVVGTDYSSSVVGVLPLDGTPAQLLGGAALGADPALASSAGRHFFIERTGGSIFELDACGRATATFVSKMSQEALPTGDPSADPQDVAVASDGSLWIARWILASALILDSHGTPSGTIDFSSYDTDHNADTASVRIIGSRAFFTMLRLVNGERSEQPSQIAVVDTPSRAIMNVITLAGRNPSALMVEQNGLLYLADSGNFDDAAETDAGIEVFDTTTLTSSLLLTEPALGGSPTEVAVSKCGATIVADAIKDVNNTSLVSFALDGSHVSVALAPAQAFNLRGLLWTDDHTLIMGDRTPVGTGYIVHIFSADPSTCALTEKAPLTMPTLPALAFAL